MLCVLMGGRRAPAGSGPVMWISGAQMNLWLLLSVDCAWADSGNEQNKERMPRHMHEVGMHTCTHAPGGSRLGLPPDLDIPGND